MTIEDEEFFCKTLRNKLPNIYFFDAKASAESNIEKRLFSSVIDQYKNYFTLRFPEPAKEYQLGKCSIKNNVIDVRCVGFNLWMKEILQKDLILYFGRSKI
ncbi:hypothetical protein SAMN05421820_107182 [Pedobacter steynii]|uniref:Uncharacterized protein n=1 Tax=Pedobacter steynii TaxID=430522 RepID=A0A1H0AT43_9SPHI|nr:hypothetical protein [Pedobacter steynii]NQX41279.1 hypothetical protein [Pedobacter steynii]SDN36226.1 hypothetical protein SAMN05421820_107182 [Pedobacter steynii]